jgi:hypothetical protein
MGRLKGRILGLARSFWRKRLRRGVCRGVVLGINIKACEGQVGRMRCRVSLRVVISVPYCNGV